MIIFNKYNIQLKLHKPEMELFAPNFENLINSEEYKGFIEKNKPREVRIIEHTYWVEDKTVDRVATEDEITEWTKDDAYLKMDNVQVFMPTYYLKCYGDETVLNILKKKLTADYNDYNTEWQNQFNKNKTALLENIKDMAIAEIVYENLMNCCDSYSQEHIAELAKEEHPLRIVAWFFEKAKIFNAETDAKDIIDIAYRDKDEKDKIYDLDSDYSETTDHKTKMSLLDKNLDEGLSVLQGEWDKLDFNGIKENCVEIYAIQQLYNTLKNDKVLYNPKHLQVMASIKKPLEFDKARLVGEKELSVATLDEINKILPKMYPDFEMEKSIFDEPKNDNYTFKIKAGKETEYAELKAHNKDNVSCELAERWGGMMENKIADGYRLADVIYDTLIKADTWQTSGSISGFSAGILLNYWEHGEDFGKCYYHTYDETEGQTIEDMKGY